MVSKQSQLSRDSENALSGPPGCSSIKSVISQILECSAIQQSDLSLCLLRSLSVMTGFSFSTAVAIVTAVSGWIGWIVTEAPASKWRAEVKRKEDMKTRI